MALARLTCGGCGAPLSLDDAVCPACGTPVELPGRSGQSLQGMPPAAAQPRAFTPAPRGEAKAPRPPAREGKRATLPRDPWPWVALLAIVALVGVVVYTQWTGDSSRPAAQRQNGAPAQAVDPSALLRLQQSVEADPNDADALLHLSNALQDNAQLERAVETYGRYLAIRPKDADARVDMGICLYQLGLADSALAPSLFARAVREMRTALAGNPAHQPAAFNLAIVFLQMGRLDSSNAWFSRAVAINKTSDLGTRAQRLLDQHSIAQ